MWKGLAGLKNAAQSARGRVFLPVATAVLLFLVFGYGQIALSGVTERKNHQGLSFTGKHKPGNEGES